MSDELKFPGPGAADRDSLGEPLTGLVRDAYLPASPAESETYWAGLEQKIMARVQAEGIEPGWWSVMAPWAKPDSSPPQLFSRSPASSTSEFPNPSRSTPTNQLSGFPLQRRHCLRHLDPEPTGLPEPTRRSITFFHTSGQTNATLQELCGAVPDCGLHRGNCRRLHG